MRLPLAAAVLLALPFAALAAPPTASGRIETDASAIEILGRPLRAGDRIEVPEGYLVVEESGPEDGQVGSFGVVPAESFATTSAAPVAADAAEPGGPAAAGEAEPDCRPQRAAYLSELWKASGIQVKDPSALLDGLAAGSTGPLQGYAWFALATDPFRALAWSSELRSRADALAACVRAGPRG